MSKQEIVTFLEELIDHDFGDDNLISLGFGASITPRDLLRAIEGD